MTSKLQPPPFRPDSPFVSHIVPSANFSERRNAMRPDMLILHYTGMPSCEDAIRCLASPQSGVSCHYVVAEDGAITQMVPEAYRAWHAGVSHWQGVEDINSCSIGIEIHNPGHDGGYPDFPDAQMAAVEALCLDIMARHGIAAAPRSCPFRCRSAPQDRSGREVRLGEAGRRAGVGHWVEPAEISGGEVLELGDGGDSVLALQNNLRTYGYGIDPTAAFDEHTKIVVSAFQRHFRPALVDGRADRSTVETLAALLDALPARLTAGRLRCRALPGPRRPLSS